MARAVDMAPDFSLARFQLGFLDLTSGRTLDAMAVWAPLSGLPDDDALRVLSEGLANMVIDNFSEARRLLERGMELNIANPVINADMQLILDEIANLPDKPATQGSPDAGDGSVMDETTEEPTPVSAVDLLLRQSRLRDDSKNTRH